MFVSSGGHTLHTCFDFLEITGYHSTYPPTIKAPRGNSQTPKASVPLFNTQRNESGSFVSLEVHDT